MIPPIPLWSVTNHLPAGVTESIGDPGGKTASSLVALAGSLADVNRQVRGQRNLDGDPLTRHNCILLPLEPLPSGVSWDVEALLALASAAGVVAVAVKLQNDDGAFAAQRQKARRALRDGGAGGPQHVAIRHRNAGAAVRRRPSTGTADLPRGG